MPILPSFCGAGVEGPTIVGEWENTGLPVGIATISLGHSYKFNQESQSAQLFHTPPHPTGGKFLISMEAELVP